MAARLLLTRGLGNGTFSGSPSKVITAGLTPDEAQAPVIRAVTIRENRNVEILGNNIIRLLRESLAPSIGGLAHGS